MIVRTFSTNADLARGLAKLIARAIAENPRLVLGLPTGRTPIPVYEELVRLHTRGLVDFSRVTTFNLDEFVGLTPHDRGSYHAFMHRHLFDHVNLSPRRHHLLDGSATDLAAECARYERAIERAGGIDLQILGLGRNGHIGFNEPGAALTARTRRVRLTLATRRANAALFDRDARKVPREALSMGIATILQARRAIIVASGLAKARCVERMIAGPVTPTVPASFLQLHANAEAWVDAEAGSLIRPSAVPSAGLPRPRQSHRGQNRARDAAGKGLSGR